MSVYQPEAFSERVNYARMVIEGGRQTSRGFDTCFEMGDGDAVATALYWRAHYNPSGNLARNIWRYLSRETVEPVALPMKDASFSAWARELRQASDEAWKRAFAEQAARNAAYSCELTPSGEQLVIPGCERNLAPGKTQLDLFG